MNMMTHSSYNAYSSGSAIFTNQSTANASGIDIVPITENLETTERGKYDVFEIANWFLSKESMTQKKLQKLCYYAQAWCYTLCNFKLMNTNFEAWIHGPVSRPLYDKFKCFGFDAIKLVGNYVSHIDAKDTELLQSVWHTYGDHTGNALEALTHTEPPWIEARAGYAPDERCSVPISVESMKRYYSSIYTGGAI